MPPLKTILQEKLLKIDISRRRTLSVNALEVGGVVCREGKKFVSFASNDYLGLAQHPQVRAAAQAAVQQYGAGAGASRLVTGNHPLYVELERLLAQYQQTEKACVFGSGYLANIGVIPALVGLGDLIIADRLAHACLLDGAILSGAKLLRFAHNDVENCANLLKLNRAKYKNCLLITETIFSMDGDAAPLVALQQIAQEYDAWLMSDSAHALAEHSSIAKLPSIDINMGTLSKALGSYGGYIAGSAELIEWLQNTARSLIYTTALPPANIAAAIASLKIIKAQPEILQKPLDNARLFCAAALLPAPQSPIVPLIIGSDAAALAAQKMLENENFLVPAIRPPTVPANTARLRLTFSALHCESDILRLAKLCSKRITSMMN